MNYHRNCSASGMFVFNNIPSFRNGATIVMVLCSDSTTARIQSSPLFRPVGYHPLFGGAGSLLCILKPADLCRFSYVILYLLFSLFI